MRANAGCESHGRGEDCPVMSKDVGGLAFLGETIRQPPGQTHVEGASPAHAGTRSRESEQVRVSIESHLTMTTTKSLVVATLLSAIAAVSMAQTPAAPKTAAAAAATAPAAAASKPMHHKKHHATHHAKKADA